MATPSDKKYAVRLGALVKLATVVASLLLLLSLVAPALFIFTAPVAILVGLRILKAKKTYLEIVGDELHYVSGKKSRVLKLSKLTSLRTNLGRAGGKREKEGVGTLSVSSSNGDRITISRVVNCISLAQSIREISGPTQEEIAAEEAKISAADAAREAAEQAAEHARIAAAETARVLAEQAAAKSAEPKRPIQSDDMSSTDSVPPVTPAPSATETKSSGIGGYGMTKRK